MNKAEEDKWIWRHNKHGMYTVKSAYLVLINDNCDTEKEGWKLIWCKILPLK
ncbi:hypothetical protein Ancab_033571, partial [Ancistrocladus abbreviatus]